MGLDLGIASVIGSGLGLGGSLFGISSSAKQAKKQMKFQAAMSNSAWSRAVRDMERAGLNPVLAAGSPASTPGGAMGQTPDIGGAITRGASTALQYKAVGTQIKKTAAEAGSAGVQKELDQLMLERLKKNPKLLDTVLTGRATGEGGGVLGSVVGGITSAIDKITAPFHRMNDKRMEDQSARQYRLLRKRREKWLREFNKEQREGKFPVGGNMPGYIDNEGYFNPFDVNRNRVKIRSH